MVHVTEGSETSASCHCSAFHVTCVCHIMVWYLPLCLGASSSPPKWDILMHREEGLQQACGDNGNMSLLNLTCVWIHNNNQAAN